ncbi:glycoside hydrolase family 6 protein [Curtobacterium citreum]|uniref:glycoside hydrolase family 6 protein n=1 Tax=Curtobacterium citreum TaxID=2036 RepID=UPI0015853610
MHHRRIRDLVAAALTAAVAIAAPSVVLSTGAANATATTTSTATVTAAAPASASATATATATAATVPRAAGVSPPARSPLAVGTIRTAHTGAVFAGGLTVQPDNQPGVAADRLAAEGRTAEAAAARTIAAQPIATWLGDWLRGDLLDRVVARNLAAAEATGTTPVFVTYAVPNRDCGGFSAGGLTAAEYTAWNERIAGMLRGHRAVVLVEPDSLSHLPTCTSEDATRPALLAAAVAAFADAGVPAYLDGGNENWNTPAVQASLLQRAGIDRARGFFTNVSNFYGVDGERAYADRVSALTGGAHYVVDVSRNGRGWLGTWCNPPGAGLGQTPRVTGGTTGLDALLWVKTPGLSDGTCNGGPAAGTWFPAYAVALVANRKP